MKKALLYLTLSVAAVLMFVPPARTQLLNAVTPGLLQARTWTFTALQTFSGGFKRPTIQVKEVCLVGCEFSTVTAALTAITDAASTKQYTVLIYPGNYDELITAKSYVTFQGVSKQTCRLRGNGTNLVNTITIPADVTGVEVRGLTVGGSIPLALSSGGTVRTSLLIADSIFGIIDGTELTNKSRDGFVLDSGVLHDITVTGSICNSTFDCWRYGKDSAYWDIDNVYNLDHAGQSNVMRIWASTSGIIQSHGIKAYVIAPQAHISTADTGNEISGFSFNSTTGTANSGNLFRLIGGDITIETTASGRTAATSCINLKATNAVAFVNAIEVYGTNCSILAAGSSSPLAGIKVDADADHSTWAIRWNGGRIALSGGSAQNDVNNAETVSGFTLALAGVEHAGIYSGAGTVSAADTRVGAFTTRLIGPVSDVGATCTKGQIMPDDGGATDEFCICIATDTVKCVTLGNANPVD